jgi:hypothetical protein
LASLQMKSRGQGLGTLDAVRESTALGKWCHLLQRAVALMHVASIGLGASYSENRLQRCKLFGQFLRIPYEHSSYAGNHEERGDC